MNWQQQGQVKNVQVKIPKCETRFETKNKPKSFVSNFTDLKRFERNKDIDYFASAYF
jgi:hypothetical protein